MNDLINNFNYDSPELREQLDTIGMTPDEVSAQGAMCPVFLGAAAVAKLLTPIHNLSGRRGNMLQCCSLPVWIGVNIDFRFAWTGAAEDHG